MSFLPDGYGGIPSNSRYMKLKDGENTFRVLSHAITGWEYWNNENRPVRLRERPTETPRDIRVESDGTTGKVKHFWAFVVYNYEDKMIQILEVTQKQIMTAVKGLVDSKHWGDPKKYDISITRSGMGFDTEYVVQGIPPTPLGKEVEVEYAKLGVKLEALFSGQDPFDASGQELVKEDVDVPPAGEPTVAEPDRYNTVPDHLKPNPAKKTAKAA